MTHFRRILVIDDQQSIHDAFRTILSSRRQPAAAELDALEASLFNAPTAPASESEVQFELDHAYQGVEGLDLVRMASERGRPFGLAFVDMRMPPGWDGVETIQRLWEVDPDLQIVVCTAYSDRIWNDVCRQLGKTDQLLLLNKPFANEYVLSLACSLCEKRRLMDTLRVELSRAQELNRQWEHEVACRKAAETTLRELATRDVLTGLPNRGALTQTLEEFGERSRAKGECGAALLFFDLDNFKLVNDSFGHRAGDELLKDIARRLTSLVGETFRDAAGPTGTVYRLGGDEFVVFLDRLDCAAENGRKAQAQAAAFAESINAALQPMFSIRNHQVVVSSSIGIAMIRPPLLDEDEALRMADTAMYRAKSAGRNRYAVFDDAMHRQVLEQLEIENDLRTALSGDQFFLHYQPIVSLESRQTIGFEALLRWRNAQGKLVPPDRFIHVAEDAGFIPMIGRWVAEQACYDFAQWKAQCDAADGCSVSINVSKLQLLETSFENDLLGICSRTGVRPAELNIEVTESMVTGSYEDLAATLHRLQGHGFRIHMDDFGTGHSSLSLLHRLPIDVIKIDRSFVATMESDPENATIVEAVIALAQNLGKKITAEGIENETQLRRLSNFGCDHGQGYLFARPGPAEEVMFGRDPTRAAAGPSNMRADFALAAP